MKLDTDNVNPDSISHNFIIERLKCPLCFSILINPVCCATCSENVCQECLNQWIKDKTKPPCPVSHCEAPEFVQSDKFFYQLLENLKFKGENPNQMKMCKGVISYEEQ